MYCRIKLFILVMLSRNVVIVNSREIISVQAGNTAIMPCSSNRAIRHESRPHVIEWLHQDHPVPVFIKIWKRPPHISPHFKGRMSLLRNSATLRITKVQIEDEGWYECRVFFFDAPVTRENDTIMQSNNKTQIKLYVTAPPAFQSTPPPVAVARLRESLLLRCRVVGKPPPDVTWRKDGWLLRNDENGIEIKGGELLIRSLTKTHRGNYKCQGRNSEGQVDHVTKVLVQAAPEITVSPMDLRITEGQDGFFYCKADGYPDDITYSWYYNGVAADDSSQLMGRYRTFNDGTLEIESVRQEDSGNVSCVASNDFGSSPSVSARLIIQYAAQVVDMPPIAYAAVSLPITLHCPYMAEPPVTTVTWRKNGNTVGIAKDENGQIYATENNELKFKAVQYSDEGIYTCTPYNILGTSGESTNMRMVVRESPRFIGRPKDNYEAEIGKPFMASCNGNGNPPPTVSWQKVGASDEYYDQYRLSRNNNNLTISSISKKDHGLWQCVLTNVVARVTANVSINVKYTTPHAARDVNVTTSSGNATVSWTPGYDGGYPQHFVVWYKRVDKGDQAWSTASVEGGRKVVTVSRLEHETVYQFSVLSENVLGSGSFSKTVTKKN